MKWAEKESSQQCVLKNTRIMTVSCGVVIEHGYIMQIPMVTSIVNSDKT